MRHICGASNGEGHEPMRQLRVALVIAATGIAVAACGGGNGGGSSSSSTTSNKPKPPLAQSVLAGLLVSPADVDAAMGVTGAKATEIADTLTEDKTGSMFRAGYKFPTECLFATGAGIAPVYAGSGNTAVHRERDVVPAPAESDDPGPQANQVVVLFPSPAEANAYFTASARSWPACANRQDTVPGDADNPEIHWSVGQISNANGMLSTTVAVTVTRNGIAASANCQRALTARNNVVIDIEACKRDPSSAAVTIANQIAGKVDKQ
jgi:hypothetical protein